MSYITSSSDSSTIERNARAPVFRSSATSAAALRAQGERQLDLVEGEELLELPRDRVARLGQHPDEVVGGQRGERHHDRQPADELGDERELEQVLGHQFLEDAALVCR